MTNAHAPPIPPADAAATKPLALPEDLFVLELEERLELVASTVSEWPKCCIS